MLFKLKSYFISLSTLLLFTSAPFAHSRPLMNLSEAKAQVEYYYECGEYDRDLDAVTNKAIQHFKKMPVTKKATVIFDIDATALDDYCHGKSLQFGFVPKLNHEWVLRANAPAIEQVKRLYDLLVARGFTIIFMTGRRAKQYDATIQNLKAEGYTVFDQLIVRQPDEECLSAKEYKTAHRKKLTKEGYTIVGNVGDQASDFGPLSGYEVRVPNYRYIID